MKLSLEIIRSFDLKERTYKPDWDDVSIEFTLKNGMQLSTMTVCCNEPCESKSLEGLDGWLYIDTKEELERINSMDALDVLKEIKASDDDNRFDINEWY